MLHRSVGLIILAVMLLRAEWRWRHPAPPLPLGLIRPIATSSATPYRRRPFFKQVADNYAISDNYHQFVMGGTAPILLGWSLAMLPFYNLMASQPRRRIISLTLMAIRR
jgi:hypothetical protein